MFRTSRRAFVLAGFRAAGVVRAILTEINTALCAIGVDSRLLERSEVTETLPGLDPETYFVVDFNNRFHLRGVRKFSFMGDHPCTRLDDLTQRHTGTEILGWVDGSHPAAVTALGFPHPSLFCPDAGPDPIAAPVPYGERDIDIFFCGTLKEAVDRASWAAAHPNWPEFLTALLFDTVDAITGSVEPALDLFLKVWAAHGVEPGQLRRAEFCALLTRVLEVAEFNRRIEVLEALPDCRLAIVSNALPARLKDRPNLTFLSRIDDYGKICDLMGRSKLVLDTTCKFPQGSHERIWFAMAQGTVLLTDRSSFMERDFADRRDILYLPKRNPAGELAELRALIEAPAALQEIAARAALTYRAKHRWKDRVAIIADAVSGAASPRAA